VWWLQQSRTGVLKKGIVSRDIQLWQFFLWLTIVQEMAQGEKI
jgi:hypothetical protein